MAKRKEQSRWTLRTEEKFTCTNSSCGFVFSKPIKVKNLREDLGIYEACPRCFTALNGIGSVLVTDAESNPRVNPSQGEVTTKVAVKETEPAVSKQCAHRFGYLSQRARDEKIPDDCMMCENIVKCMTKGMTA